MDPASAFGIVTGAMQTVQIIGSTLKGLRSLHGKYVDADMTIHSLIVQAVTIKSAISQLHDWATHGSGRAEHPDYLEGLDIAVDGCKASMECLLTQVSKVTSVLDGSEMSTLRARDKLRAVWDDQLMQDYQQRLQSQVLALNFLLQVCQCRTVTEQTELLRREENRRLLKKVAQDTATLRSSIRQQGNASALSISRSTISDTALDLDDMIVNAAVYRRAMAHNLTASIRVPPESTGLSNAHRPATPKSMTTDEGYASGTVRSQSFRGSNTLSPPSTFFEPNAGDTSESQQDIGRSASLAVSPKSTPRMRRWQSNPTPSQRSESKREKLRRVFSKLDTSSRGSLKKTSPLLGPQTFFATPAIPEQGTPGLNRSRSYTSTSIDMSSPDNADIPSIIKAAQAGSLVQIEMQIGEGANINTCHQMTGRSALAVAAHCGNEEVVDYLLQQGAKADTQEVNGSTALHLAASRGHTGVIQVLLPVVENIEVKDSLGRTPFWVAAEGGHIDTVQMLLAAGCKITARAKGQMTALHKTAIRGDCEMAALLLQSGADIEAKDADMKSALHHACENRQHNLCRTLLSHKVDIEAVEMNKRTPLFYAAMAGDALSVEYLIRKKASMFKTDDGGRNPMHAAAANGHVEVVQFLLERHWPQGLPDKCGMSALHVAVVSGQFAVAEFLLRKGGPMELKSRGGFTALHHACDMADIELARHLVGCGANIEAQGDGQQRPIHIAVARNSLEIVELLCQKGVQVDSADSSGTRALCIACRNGNAPIVERLLDRGAVTSSSGTWNGVLEEQSPLVIASRAGDARIVSLLLNKGASVEQHNESGWDLLLYAAHYGHAEVLQLLLANSSIHSRRNLARMFSQIGFHPELSIEQERVQFVRDLIYQETPFMGGSSAAGMTGGVGRGGLFYHSPHEFPRPPLSFPLPAELSGIPRIQLPPDTDQSRPPLAQSSSSGTFPQTSIHEPSGPSAVIRPDHNPITRTTLFANSQGAISRESVIDIRPDHDQISAPTASYGTMQGNVVDRLSGLADLLSDQAQSESLGISQAPERIVPLTHTETMQLGWWSPSRSPPRPDHYENKQDRTREWVGVSLRDSHGSIAVATTEPDEAERDRPEADRSVGDRPAPERTEGYRHEDRAERARPAPGRTEREILEPERTLRDSAEPDMRWTIRNDRRDDESVHGSDVSDGESFHSAHTAAQDPGEDPTTRAAEIYELDGTCVGPWTI